MDFLPPMKIAQGEPFSYSATVVGQDWTGYTGTAIFKTKPQAVASYINGEAVQEPILTDTVTGNSAGLLSFALTGTETAELPALPRLGYFHAGVMQITMTNGTDTKRYQARVSVAGAI